MHSETVQTGFRALPDIIDRLDEVIGGINDWPDAAMRPGITALMASCRALEDSAPRELRANLAALLVSTRQMSIEDRESYQMLRLSHGLREIDTALHGIDEAARLSGYAPPDEAHRAADTLLVPRQSQAEGFEAFTDRLDRIAEDITALRQAAKAAGNHVQQNGLVNFYAGQIEIKIGETRLVLTLSDMIDMAALERLVSGMARMTRNFMATMSSRVATITKAVSDQAGKVAQAVAESAKSLSNIFKALKSRPKPARPARQWSEEEIRDMVLRGETPPEDAVPFARRLNFRSTDLADLAPLAALTALESLSLSGTQITDITPLGTLTALETLFLNGTQVADITPLGKLTALETLDLRGTQVADITSLGALTALEALFLNGTQVADITPLSTLTALQRLSLNGTQVADITPLGTLTAINTLFLGETLVTDITPLGKLTALKSLFLNGTQVADITPLGKLTALETLDLDEALHDAAEKLPNAAYIHIYCAE